MTNIFSAFRDYERADRARRAHRKAFSWERDDPGPLFEATLDERRAILARVRESYPEVYAPRPEQEIETPIEHLLRVSEASINTPIAASQTLIAQYKLKPAAPPTPVDPTVKAS